jgi:hypothetical protein
MKKHLLLGGLAAVLAIGYAASTVFAAAVDPCPLFEHPKKAKQFKAEFVQAFVSCGNVGGNSPNSTINGGAVGSCQPPETYATQQGTDLTTGWHFDPLKGQGAVQFKAAKAGPTGGVNSDLTADADVVGKVKLKGIVSQGGIPVDAESGTLATVSRATLDDSAGGPMTVVDFPLQITFSMVGGKTSTKFSADAKLDAGGLSGLPHCTSIETIDTTLLDVDGTTFARVGLWLP